MSKAQTEISNTAIRNPNSTLLPGWRWARLGEVLEALLKNALNYRKETFGLREKKEKGIKVGGDKSRGKIRLRD